MNEPRYHVGDVVYAPAFPDRFGRILSYVEGYITRCLPGEDCAGYLIKSRSYCSERFFNECQLYESVEEVIDAVRNYNIDVKKDELFEARLQMANAQEHIDAWEGFDPKTVRIEMEENHD